MKYLLKVWNWLNGKKTAFGVAGIFLSGGLGALCTHLGICLPEQTIAWLLTASLGLAGAGAIHKGLKRELF